MPRVLLVGFFDFVDLDTGGQPVKTRELYRLLREMYGEESVDYIETLGWKKNPARLLLELYKKTKRCDVIIMLPAHNGVEVFGRILAFIKKKTGKKIFYDVVGGWLPTKLSKEPKLKGLLKQFDGIWVETTSMKNGLEEQGLVNVLRIPNFKKLTPLAEEEFVVCNKPPFKLCTFSRVNKEKGIEEAVRAVTEINEAAGSTVYTLDIYGQIYEPYVERFDQLKSSFADYIQYKGVADPSGSVEVLKNYFALLFPTHYYTEGVPGTLIDACFAGVPVITALWLNHKDVFEEDKTGWSFEFDNYDEFKSLLERAASDPESFNKMKKTSLEAAQKFTPKAAAELIEQQILAGW